MRSDKSRTQICRCMVILISERFQWDDVIKKCNTITIIQVITIGGNFKAYLNKLKIPQCTIEWRFTLNM